MQYKYRMGTYGSEREFNALQDRFKNTLTDWRVHSWQVNEGDGSITVLWEKVEQENADNGKSE